MAAASAWEERNYKRALILVKTFSMSLINKLTSTSQQPAVNFGACKNKLPANVHAALFTYLHSKLSKLHIPLHVAFQFFNLLYLTNFLFLRS